MSTRHDSPNAASHAPKVRIIIAINNSEKDEPDIEINLNNIKFKIIASRASKAIKMCVRWITIVKNAIMTQNGIKDDGKKIIA